MAQYTRKPPVYLAVMLPIFWLGLMTLCWLLLRAYHSISGTPLNAIHNRNGLLLLLPAFVLWIPLSLLLSNVVLYVTPPLRRVAERYVMKSNHPGFLKSQQMLLKMTGLLALVCIPLIALGFWV
jgi:hypothetical protein